MPVIMVGYCRYEAQYFHLSKLEALLLRIAVNNDNTKEERYQIRSLYYKKISFI